MYFHATLPKAEKKRYRTEKGIFNQMYKYTEYMDKMNEKYEKILENNKIKNQ